MVVYAGQRQKFSSLLKIQKLLEWNSDESKF